MTTTRVDRFPSKRVPIWLLPAFLSLLLLNGAAFAAPSVSIEVAIAQASHEGSAIDPALSKMKSKLQSMFNYTSYKMLDRQKRTIPVGSTGEIPLPGNRVLKATPASLDGTKIKLNVQILEGGKDKLTTSLGLNKGGMVLVGGPSYQNGVLILIISAE
ncbi:MAG TPA: hypothetical protein VIU29_11025 [Candidatus Deferrimicrobiaceae bacterium]